MLGNFLDGALGSTTKVRLLRALLPLTCTVSGREAAALAGVRSQSGAQQALTDLARLGIVEKDRIRGAWLYRLNRAHHAAPALAALFAAEGERFSSLRDLLSRELHSQGLLARVQGVTLFGSAARGDARPGSDLDLLVVTDTARSKARVTDAMLDARAEAERTLGVSISALVMPRPRLRQRWRAGDPLLQNIHAEGRVVLGAPIHELARDG
ncbi:MAG TPA: nucleotidyltransferase domain-containing protein [Longimicrobiaceae bacterium]